jgi:predicted GIY-YIG superfamily endonuclease
MAAMFVNRSGQKWHSLESTFHICFLQSFRLFGKAVSEEKIFKKSTNQKQELSVAAMFVN